MICNPYADEADYWADAAKQSDHICDLFRSIWSLDPDEVRNASNEMHEAVDDYRRFLPNSMRTNELLERVHQLLDDHLRKRLRLIDPSLCHMCGQTINPSHSLNKRKRNKKTDKNTDHSCVECLGSLYNTASVILRAAE